MLQLKGLKPRREGHRSGNPAARAFEFCRSSSAKTRPARQHGRDSCAKRCGLTIHFDISYAHSRPGAEDDRRCADRSPSFVRHADDGDLSQLGRFSRERLDLECRYLEPGILNTSSVRPTHINTLQAKGTSPISRVRGRPSASIAVHVASGWLR